MSTQPPRQIIPLVRMVHGRDHRTTLAHQRGARHPRPLPGQYRTTDTNRAHTRQFERARPQGHHQETLPEAHASRYSPSPRLRPYRKNAAQTKQMGATRLPWQKRRASAGHPQKIADVNTTEGQRGDLEDHVQWVVHQKTFSKPPNHLLPRMRRLAKRRQYRTLRHLRNS